MVLSLSAFDIILGLKEVKEKTNQSMDFILKPGLAIGASLCNIQPNSLRCDEWDDEAIKSFKSLVREGSSYIGVIHAITSQTTTTDCQFLILNLYHSTKDCDQGASINNEYSKFTDKKGKCFAEIKEFNTYMSEEYLKNPERIEFLRPDRYRKDERRRAQFYGLKVYDTDEKPLITCQLRGPHHPYEYKLHSVHRLSK